MKVQDCLLLVLRKQRQEDHEFRASLGFILIFISKETHRKIVFLCCPQPLIYLIILNTPKPLPSLDSIHYQDLLM